MKPPKTRHTSQMDWVRIELRNLIDARHPLVQLTHKINWVTFDEKFGSGYAEEGRPAVETRLMVALNYLKWTYDLSDEEVVARWMRIHTGSI